MAFLYQQRSKDPRMAATLTLLELPNVLVLVERLRELAQADLTVSVATQVERLLQNLGQAIEALLAYRRAGGENHMNSGRLAALVAQTVAAGQGDAVVPQLAALLDGDQLPDAMRPFVRALRAVAEGSRDAGLASDPGMSYAEVVELRLLLEAVASAG